MINNGYDKRNISIKNNKILQMNINCEIVTAANRTNQSPLNFASEM